MPIVGFNYTNIIVERKAPVQGVINVANNVVVTKIEEADLSLSQVKQDGIRFTYEFNSKYSSQTEPEIGKVVLIGEVLYIEDLDKVKAILHEWQKNKKIAQEVMGPVYNTILEKCHVQALILSRDVNLPPPIQLPTIGPNTPKVSEKIAEPKKPSKK